MIIRVAVLDDEWAFCEQLAELVATWGARSGNSVEMGRYTSSDPFLIDAEESGFDVAFLDIRLQENRTGLEVASELHRTDQDTFVILISNESTHVQEAFDAQVFQYLFKPVQQTQVERYMSSAVDRIKMRPKSFYVRSFEHSKVRLPLKDILYFSSSGHHLDIHLRNEIMSERKLLKDVETQLPDQFLRCSKSLIVNLDQVVRLDSREMILSNGEALRIGPKYLETLRSRWLTLFT
ncbi:MAG: response regulator transcription factor [Clostridia bacterium]|nr:response regulator transcription factor [Clostridia bacterium]